MQLHKPLALQGVSIDIRCSMVIIQRCRRFFGRCHRWKCFHRCLHLRLLRWPQHHRLVDVQHFHPSSNVSQLLFNDRLMQSYPPRALDGRLLKDWARHAREGPRVLMSLWVDFGPMGYVWAHLSFYILN